METLEINKSNALKAFNEANEKGKVLLTNLFGKEVFNQKITDRIKSLDDVLQECDVSIEDFAKSTKFDSKDEIAYKQLKLIAKALNEGWVPDWNNSSEYKYSPYFDMRSTAGFGFSVTGCDGWITHSVVGSRLCFKSRELAEYAGKQFEAVYNDFLTL